MVIQNLGGWGGGGGGGERCITVDVKVVNCFELQIIPSRFFASLARASKQPIKKQEIITRMHSVVRKIQIELDLTGVYAQLFSLRRKTQKYTTLRIVFCFKKNAALESSTDKLSDKHYSKCWRKKIGVLSLLYDVYSNQPEGR